MGQKKKLKRFAENNLFSNVFQPLYTDLINDDFGLKGNWKQQVFKNNNPITAELGCGKGDYVTALSGLLPLNNYIGIDIKGARIWKGAKYAEDKAVQNVAFLRTRIECSPHCFEKNEINEIWITFPDPQLNRKKRIKKRLTSARFLGYYQKILINNGVIHVKTDDDELFAYTKKVIEFNNLKLEKEIRDIYTECPDDKILSIRTYYETKWLTEGRTIKYLCFRLPDTRDIVEPDTPDED